MCSRKIRASWPTATTAYKYKLKRERRNYSDHDHRRCVARPGEPTLFAREGRCPPRLARNIMFAALAVAASRSHCRRNCCRRVASLRRQAAALDRRAA